MRSRDLLHKIHDIDIELFSEQMNDLESILNMTEKQSHIDSLQGLQNLLDEIYDYLRFNNE